MKNTPLKLNKNDKKQEEIKEIEKENTLALEGELLIAAPAEKPKFVTLLMDHVFQTGMPGRESILITLEFKKDQIVTDPQTIQTLIDTGAPIKIG